MVLETIETKVFKNIDKLRENVWKLEIICQITQKLGGFAKNCEIIKMHDCNKRILQR